MTHQQYKEFVRHQVITRSGLTFLNSDEDKMKTVYLEMLNNAQYEFRIFAGTLVCSVTDSPEFVETLSDYIERGGKLYILLNNYNEEQVLQSQLFKRLAYYKFKQKDIIVKQSNDHPFIITPEGNKDIHFSLGDKKSYRVETDIVKRTAICNMNNPKKAEQFATFFDDLFRKAENTEIDLVKLFKMQ